MSCQFTGSAFGLAAIWQYESLKSRVQSYFDEVQADWLEKLRPQKRGDIRRQVRTIPVIKVLGKTVGDFFNQFI